MIEDPSVRIDFSSVITIENSTHPASSRFYSPRSSWLGKVSSGKARCLRPASGRRIQHLSPKRLKQGTRNMGSQVDIQQQHDATTMQTDTVSQDAR